MDESEAKKTKNHQEIQRWAEERDGKPASVKGTGHPGVLRIEFEGFGEGSYALEAVSWEDWFKKFDEEDLTFLYQEKKTDGENSTFFKLIND